MGKHYTNNFPQLYFNKYHESYSSLMSYNKIEEKIQSFLGLGKGGWWKRIDHEMILKIYEKNKRYRIVFGLTRCVLVSEEYIHFLLVENESNVCWIHDISLYDLESTLTINDTTTEIRSFGDRFVIGEDYIYLFKNNYSVGKPKSNHIINKEESETLIHFLKEILKFIKNNEKNIVEKKQNEKELLDKRLVTLKNNYFESLDLNNDGQINLIESESLNKLLSKHQSRIIEIDKSYIQKFVKISLYLKTKKNNIQSLFSKLKSTKKEDELNEFLNLLKNQIHTYELLCFHSLNMITSIVEDDLITFYEIYECFDQLGVFNSNWENEVSNKLNSIEEGIQDLLYSINHMELTIVSSINNLSYTTQESFKLLSNSVEKQLTSINSSIKFNNLLTGIQTYQMYKINQNTKRIN